MKILQILEKEVNFWDLRKLITFQCVKKTTFYTSEYKQYNSMSSS